MLASQLISIKGVEYMKKNIVYILVAFILIAIVVVGVIASRPKPNPVIIKNEIVLQNEKDDYMQVRHIVVRGSNEGIGKALGEIARREYKAKLIKYAEPIYSKARLQYMKTNYPILLERMKGVAIAYGLSFDNTDYDTSNLYYCAPAPKCSAIFFLRRFQQTAIPFIPVIEITTWLACHR